jgi:hypothetical protein
MIAPRIKPPKRFIMSAAFWANEYEAPVATNVEVIRILYPAAPMNLTPRATRYPCDDPSMKLSSDYLVGHRTCSAEAQQDDSVPSYGAP